jgi:hypothetical protein
MKTNAGYKIVKNASGKSEPHVLTHWTWYETIFRGKDKTVFGLTVVLHYHHIPTCLIQSYE